MIKKVLILLMVIGCTAPRKYYTVVVIEKSQPNNRIQTKVLYENGEHYIYPNLTIDESDSLELGDTLLIYYNTLKLVK